MPEASLGLARASLVLVSISFELHILAMSICEYGIVDWNNATNTKDGAVKALLILAYLLLIISISLLLLINYAVLQIGKVVVIVTSAVIFLSVFSVVTSIGIHAEHKRFHGGIDPGPITAFITGALSALTGAIIILFTLR